VLKEITLPEGMTTVPKQAFREMTSLETVVLPDSIKTIGDYALYGCTGLKNITFSKNLETISSNAFYDCKSLTTINSPDSLKTIDYSAFYNCSGLTSVTFSKGLTTIGDSAFSNCSGLTSVEIPSSITTINSSVFSGCSGLTSVTFPETLTKIYSYALSGCTSLESIEIPDSVTDISARAFYNCTKLSSVKLPLGWKNVLDYYYDSADRYSDSSDCYQSPFVGCTVLKEITLPEGMTTVPKQAFRELTSLETVVLPDSIKTISAYAFYGCSKLSVLDLPDSVKVIGNSAFYGCSGFRMLNFNENLESIGSYAFSGCNGLVSMVLNENLQTVSNYAFSNCANLTAARVPKSVTSFGADSFYNCPKLTIYCYSGSAAHMALENTSYKYFLLDEHEHEYDITVETAATCTRGGSQIKTCKICGYNYIELVAPLGHDYETKVVEPNCTEKGYTTYTCKRCGDKYNDDYVDALGHHYGEWQVRTESTCTEKGVKYRTCSVCSKEEIREISAKGHPYEINVQEPTCIERGYTEHTCRVCGYSYKDKYVNAKGHSYGEWIVDEAASVLSKGSKHRVCTECGHTETQTIAQVIVDINTNKNYGRANFTIVDAQTLEPIKNACIFISTEKDGENTFSTDSNGKVSIVLPVGKQTISVYADGCITRNTKITVKSGINDIPKIGLSEKPTYDAKITSKPMTIEEIKEAGIDTSAPENQHVYKYELKLDFDPEIDTSSIISYFNSEGDYLGGYYAGNSTGSGGSGGGTAEPSDPTYNLHYHVVTGGIWHSWCKSIEVEKGQNVSLTYHPYRDDENYVFDGWYEDDSFTKKIYSTHIKDYSTYVYGRWIYVGEGEEQKISTNPGITIPTKDEVITVYPVSEHFYLIVRGEVKWLKEMFDVEMLVVNNSNTDTLENLTVSLTLPKGLSLADMNGEQQTLDKKIDNIPEGKSESVHWYVRGDVAGSYSLEARLKGKIMPFEEDIDDTFVSENQLQVWAGNALNLHFDFPNAAYYGEDYPITITLSNVSDKTLYNINHIVQIEQGMEIYYSDGSKKEKIEKSSWKSIGVREFNPGDKIIIQTSTNIFFKSEIIENKLESLVGIVDGVEQLINAYKAIKTAVDATESLVNCVSGCSKALDNFDFTIATESTEKLKLFKTLHQKVSGLMLSYSTSGNKTIDASVKLANTGINTSLNAITDNPDEWLKNNSVDDIKSLLTKIDALENSISESGATSRKFDIYDSIRTAISAIPIRFALSNVIMTEDDNNTTSIPWSYSVSQSSAQYFGVSSVSKYLTSITKATMGEIYDESMPWYLQLIPGLDDPFNQDEAIGYIKATENEIAQFKAKDATGDVTFKAWVESNESVQNISTFASAPLNSASNFVLSSDNKSATVGINGVLTFKGDGMISVKPLSQTGGTLYIEDSEGNLYTYVIDVVAQHECTAGERETVIAPTKDYDGFAVKCCKVCGEIMEIDNLQFENICKNHTYGEWKTETSSTCTQSGIDTRSCSVCGKIEYEFTDKKEHSCNDWKITKAATCQDQGEKQSVCTECGETITRSIEKIPHTDGNWEVVKEATAFEEGLKKLHCKNCDEVIQSSIIPMTKETFGYSKDSQDRILMGIPECITPEMLVKHYDNMGLAVRISDSEGNLPEYVGTGCKVFFDNVEYSVVLKGDTSGDGVIDIFDYYEILDYLNGKGTLTGNYYKASLITSDEPSIFDAYAIIDYINDCGALEQ